MSDAAFQGAARWPPVLVPGQGARLRRRGVQVAVLPAAFAWGTLILLPLGPLDLQICATFPAGAGAGAAFSQALALEWVSFNPKIATFEWLLMVVAMMLPLTAANIDHLSARTFRRDRRKAVCAFLAGYLSIWAVLAIPAVGFTLVARAGLQSSGPAAGAPLVPLALAALWWVSAPRALALARCHFRPTLPAQGPEAVRGSAVLGVRNGTYCAVTCLPLMLGMQVAGGGVIGMALLSAMIFAERAAHRPNPKGAAWVLIAFAAPLSLI